MQQDLLLYVNLLQIEAQFGDIRGGGCPGCFYNLRNFWDGRADAWFNGVNPLGVRDQNAAVKSFAIKAGKPTITNERMRIPYSSLASQAVGPLGSNVEVIFDGRPLRELGRLLTSPNTQPLSGQAIASGDSLLAPVRDGSGRGLSKHYTAFIKESFDERFWGNGAGQEVCVSNTGVYRSLLPASGSCVAGDYTLMQWNFPLFFGLAHAPRGDTAIYLMLGRP